MKKSILIAFVVFTVLLGSKSVSAQFTIDNVYTTDLPQLAVKLNSGLKYYSSHSVLAGPTFTVLYFVLYNSDHSIYRIINIPQISGKNVNSVAFVSDALFNLDTLVEYMLNYQDVSTYVHSVAVVNENGSNLLYVDSADYITGVGAPFMGFIANPIFPDGNQTKLYLSTNTPPAASSTPTTTVYNLPGQLACLDCNNGFVNGIVQPSGLSSDNLAQLKSFPNPNDGNATIEFKLPQGIHSGEIVLYSMDGSEIKRFKVDDTFGNLVLGNSGLSSGTYIYQLTAGNKAIDAKRMIVIH